ncbi:hypothetical protein Bca4012_037882 [Brassica carinata]
MVAPNPDLVTCLLRVSQSVVPPSPTNSPVSSSSCSSTGILQKVRRRVRVKGELEAEPQVPYTDCSQLDYVFRLTLVSSVNLSPIVEPWRLDDGYKEFFLDAPDSVEGPNNQGHWLAKSTLIVLDLLKNECNSEPLPPALPVPWQLVYRLVGTSR